MMLATARKIIKAIKREGFYHFVLKSFFHLILKHIYVQLLYLFSTFTNKNNSIVIFGSRYGYKYNNNPMYVFERVLEDDTIKPIWVTRSKQVYDKLKQEDKPVVHMYSIKYIILLCESSVGVIAYDKTDIAHDPSHLPDSLNILNLQEGYHPHTTDIGSVKYDSKNIYHSYNTSYFHDLRNDKIMNKEITGYAKNDVLVNPTENVKEDWEKFISNVGNEFELILLYAPSKKNPSRWQTPTALFPFDDFSETQLDSFLNENNILLLVNLHPTDYTGVNSDEEFYQPLRQQVEKLDENVRNIEFINEHFNDLNKVMPFSDILISDYSSAVFDYLLLDRPMLFIPYDYDTVTPITSRFDRREERYVFDFDTDFPGPRIESFSDFRNSVREIMDSGDIQSSKRERIRDKIHKHSDGKNIDRIVQLIHGLRKGDIETAN